MSTYQAHVSADLETAINQAGARGLRVLAGQAQGRKAVLFVLGSWVELTRWLEDPSGALTFYGPAKRI